MRRGAQGAGWLVCRRTHQLRELIYRVCLTEARSAKGVTRYTPRPRTTGCPKAKPQGRSQQGRLCLGYFHFAENESDCAAGRTSRHLREAQKSQNKECYQKQSPDLSRTGGNSPFHPKAKSAHLPKPSPAAHPITPTAPAPAQTPTCSPPSPANAAAPAPPRQANSQTAKPLACRRTASSPAARHARC